MALVRLAATALLSRAIAYRDVCYRDDCHSRLESLTDDLPQILTRRRRRHPVPRNNRRIMYYSSPFDPRPVLRFPCFQISSQNMISNRSQQTNFFFSFVSRDKN